MEMAFDLEVVMSGLGAVWPRTMKRRDPHPSGVEFLMVACHHGHAHQPRLTFRFEDLAAPEVELPAHVGAGGAILASYELAGKSVEFSVEGGGADGFDVVWCEDEEATAPGEGAPMDAFDWIPSFGAQLGLPNVVGPESPDAAQVYAARVSLPAGRLSSWRLFPLEGASSPDDWQLWSFGDTAPRVLAEYAVLASQGVDRLVAKVDGQELVFDDRAPARSAGGALRLAVTNLPPMGRTGRFLSPDHFPMYRAVNSPPQNPWPVRRANGGPVPASSGVACPPGKPGDGG
jgi:hypothetical protein